VAKHLFDSPPGGDIAVRTGPRLADFLAQSGVTEEIRVGKL